MATHHPYTRLLSQTIENCSSRSGLMVQFHLFAHEFSKDNPHRSAAKPLAANQARLLHFASSSPFVVAASSLFTRMHNAWRSWLVVVQLRTLVDRSSKRDLLLNIYWEKFFLCWINTHIELTEICCLYGCEYYIRSGVFIALFCPENLLMYDDVCRNNVYKNYLF